MIDRDQLLANIRATRNMKLEKSDISLLQLLETSSSWTDYNAKRQAWVDYRQALRDYPANIPDDIEGDFSNIPAIPLSPTEQAALDAAVAAETPTV